MKRGERYGLKPNENLVREHDICKTIEGKRDGFPSAAEYAKAKPAVWYTRMVC